MTKKGAKVGPMAPKSAQKEPKSSLLGAQSVTFSGKVAKSAPLLKHQYLQWFKHIGPSDSGLISTPKSLKKQPWTQSCHLGDPIHKKVTKNTPKGTPRGTQNRLKINRNRHRDTKVPQWVALGVPGPPKWCPRCQNYAKMVPQGTQKPPQGSKMEPKREL